ncbi:MAG: molecular chaperone TorD family protein [bacterium]|nr:molecular chaperone TorD family protein [bacterium]
MEYTLARAALYNFFAAAVGDAPTPALAATAREMSPDLPSIGLDELQLEYTRLLIGPGKHYTPPYASIHLHSPQEGKALLWGTEATVVEDIYRAAGLKIETGQPRVPDHLALELQFMHHLCACEANSATQGQVEEAALWRSQQQTFLRERLLTWLPGFVKKIKQAQTLPFYGKVGEITLEFLQTELNANTE